MFSHRQFRLRPFSPLLTQRHAAHAFLHSRGIIVRPVGGYGLTDCLRITVGTEDENRALLDALSEFAAS